MQTCVVAIANTSSCPNYLHIPPTFIYDDIRFIVHHKPQREQKDGHWICNYDLLLDVGYKTTFEHADFKSPRLTKFEQAVVLKQASIKAQVESYISVPIYNKVENVKGPEDVTELPDLVLIKSNDGARGLAHILYDTTKGSVFDFLRGIHGANVDKVCNVIQEHKAAIELHTGKPRDDGEVYCVLGEQSMLVSKPITGITAELRVLLDHNSKPVLIKERERCDNSKDGNNTDYLQATGANRSKDTRVDSLDEYCPEYAGDMLKVLSLLPPMNSVDLFITEKGWGIFEYCHQFGTEAFEPRESTAYHCGLIIDLYLRKYSKETLPVSLSRPIVLRIISPT